MQYKIKCLAVVGFLATTQLVAQNINSPYSVYGIGDIDYKDYSRLSGMAGTGLASTSGNFIINKNPASVSGLDKGFFIINVGATARFSTYSGQAIDFENSTNNDFWIKNLSLGIKVNNFWSTNIGFGQFSNVGYKMSGTRTEQGTINEYDVSYEGDGGLTEYHWTNSISLGKRVALGIKASFISGSINQHEIIDDDNLSSTLTTTQQDYFSDWRLQYGVLYKIISAKKWEISLGGKYSPSTRLSTEREISVLQDGAILVDDKFIKRDRFVLPTAYSAGITLVHKKKTTIAFDYLYEDWSALKIRGNGWRYTDNHRLSGGVEFAKFIRQWNMPVEKRFFQLGAFLNNSYLQVRGKQIQEYGFTAGTGGRLGGMQYGLAGTVGVRGTTAVNLIKENYVQLTFTLSYRDFLFSKGRKYD